MEDCFLLNQDTKQFPKKNAAPLVLFRSSTLPSKSASVDAFKMKSWIFGYQNPCSIVPFKYLKILFIVVTCVSLGLDWNLEAKYIAAASCFTQVIWTKQTLEDLLVKYEHPIVINCDNTSAIYVNKSYHKLQDKAHTNKVSLPKRTSIP